MGVSIGGIEFSFDADPREVVAALRALRQALKETGKDTENVDAQLKKVNKSVEDSTTQFNLLGTTVRGLGVALGGAIASAGKFGLIIGGTVLAGVTALEFAVGKLTRALGSGLLRASNEYLRIGIELEKTQFGLQAALDSYRRATGDASVSLERLVTASRRLQQVTGVSADEIRQAQLIMLEMSRSTGLTAEQIDKLIERAADFAVVAKQDFLDVIIAIDNAFVGLPRRLTNMGINVTRAALNMQQGSRTAAVYNKIMESTEFAVGKVAQAFDENLFGALKRNQAAWESYNQTVAQATLTIREDLTKALVDLDTQVAQVASRFPTLIASLQFFGGPLLQIIGTIVQFTSILSGVRLALLAINFVAASKAIPSLTALVEGMKASFNTLAAYTKAVTGVAEGAGAAATAWTLLTKAGRILIGEVFRNLLFVLRLALRFFPLVAAAVGGLVGALKLLDAVTRDATEDLLNEAKAQQTQLSVLRRALQVMEAATASKRRSKEEQEKLNAAIEEANRILPGTTALLGEQGERLEENIGVIQRYVSNLESLRQATVLVLEDKARELTQTLQSLREELEAEVENLAAATKAFTQAEASRQAAGLLGKAVGALGEFFGIGGIQALERRQQAINELAQQIAEVERRLSEITALIEGQTDAVKEQADEFAKLNREALQAERRLIVARRELELLRARQSVMEQIAQIHEEINDVSPAIRTLEAVRRQVQALEQQEQRMREIVRLQQASFRAQERLLELQLKEADERTRVEIEEELRKLRDQREAFMVESRAELANLGRLLDAMREQEVSLTQAFRRDVRRAVSDFVAESKAAFTALSQPIQAIVERFRIEFKRAQRENFEETKRLMQEFERAVEPMETALRRQLQDVETRLAETRQRLRVVSDEQTRKALRDQERQLEDSLRTIQTQLEDFEKQRHEFLKAQAQRQEAILTDLGRRTADAIGQEINSSLDRIVRLSVDASSRIVQATQETVDRLRELRSQDIEDEARAMEEIVRIQEEGKSRAIRILHEARQQALQALEQLRRGFEAQSKLAVQTELSTVQGAVRGQEEVPGRVFVSKEQVSRAEERLRDLDAVIRQIQLSLGGISEASADAMRLLDAQSSRVERRLREVAENMDRVRERLAEADRLSIEQIAALPKMFAQSSRSAIDELTRFSQQLQERVEFLGELIERRARSVERVRARQASIAEEIARKEREIQQVGEGDLERKKALQEELLTLQSRFASAIEEEAQLVSGLTEAHQAVLSISERRLAVEDRIKALTKETADIQRQAESEIATRRVQVAEERLRRLEEEGASREDRLKARLEFLKAEEKQLELEGGESELTREQRKRVRAEIEKTRAALKGGVLFDFFDELERFSDQTVTTFGLMRTLADETARQMQQSFAQFFFDVFEGRVTSMKDFFRSVMRSIEVIAAQTAASLVTKGIFKLLASFGASIIGGMFGGGEGGSEASATEGNANADITGSSLSLPEGEFFQRGGLVRGRRIFGDRVPSLLEPGEFVMKRKAVEKFGLKTMEEINDGRQPVPVAVGTERDKKGVTIVNLSDPDEIRRFLAQNPDAVVNIVSRDVKMNGQMRRVLMR
ncbi:MAG: hypothetical protein Q9M19_04865 [Mariprofundaceae bacterium]|nr:hypothetical protein [Mariprofundaceae bacterium]